MRGADDCKNVVLALGVSLPTETTILSKGLKSNFLEEPPMDFDNFAAGAEFAFSRYGCRKLQNVDPCARRGSKFILLLAQRGALDFATCDTLPAKT